MAPWDIVAIFGCFGGVVMVAIADPGEGQQVSPMFESLSCNVQYTIGIAAAISMSMAFSVWMVSVRKLKDLHYSVIFLVGMLFDAAFAFTALIIQLLYCWLWAPETATWPFQLTNLGFKEFVACACANCGA